MDANKKVDFAFCLREIAHNIEEYNSYGMRIGLSVLAFCGNEYEVIDWHGNKYQFADLGEAIVKFIHVQPDCVKQ